METQEMTCGTPPFSSVTSYPDSAASPNNGISRSPKKKESAGISIPVLLRRLGAALLVVASAIFLLQRWDNLDQIGRYMSFLGFTGVLAILGAYCGVLLKDDRAARTLLGVAAFVVPIHFAQLGGFLYSVFPERFATAIQYPDFVHFQAHSPMTAISVTIFGLLLLIPITYFANSVFVRPHAKEVTMAYLGLSSLLLLPVRNPDIIGWLGMLSLMTAVTLDAKFWRKERVFKTPEGKQLRTLLFFPTILLIGRTLYLYDTSALFIGSVFAGVALLMFVVIPQYSASDSYKASLQGFAMIPASLASLIFSAEFIDVYSVPAEYAIPLIVVPLSIMLLICSRLTTSPGDNYQFTAVMFSVPTLVLNGLVYPSVTSSLLAISVSIAAILAGKVLDRPATYFFGLIGLGITLFHHLEMAVDFNIYSPWMVVAMFGLGAIFLSAYIERRNRLKGESSAPQEIE
ncbi:MAG: hypothetical protein KDD70_13525 [Bdellovibrionales bacterium]|nr:hypothetical protein [Bdellovibrionales bacterium]